jgi:hypothetical protein
MSRLLLVLAFAATPVLAGTYKWVDEKGVTNYSNNPPPSSKPAQKLAVVEDRLSVYSPDPMLRRAAEMRGSRSNADYAEAEWLQRQRIMQAQRQAYQPYPADYRDSYRVGSFYYPSFRLPGAAARRPAPRQGFP